MLEPLSPLKYWKDAERLHLQSYSLLLFTTGVGSGEFGGTSDLVDSTFNVLELLSGLMSVSDKSVSLEEHFLIVLLSDVKVVVDEGES